MREIDDPRDAEDQREPRRDEEQRRRAGETVDELGEEGGEGHATKACRCRRSIRSARCRRARPEARSERRCRTAPRGGCAAAARRARPTSSAAVSASARGRAQPLARPHDRDAERLLVQVVDRRRAVAELPLGEARKRGDRQRDVVDDDRRAGEAQPIADPEDAVAGGDAEVLRGGAIGLGLGEREELDLGIALRPLLVDDVEEIEEHPVAVVARDVRAAALLPDQDVLGDELVDRPADGADAGAEALGEQALGRDRFAGLPLAARQRLREPALDVLVQRAGERHAGRLGIAREFGHRGRSGRGGAAIAPMRQCSQRCQVMQIIQVI